MKDGKKGVRYVKTLVAPVPKALLAESQSERCDY